MSDGCIVCVSRARIVDEWWAYRVCIGAIRGARIVDVSYIHKWQPHFASHVSCMYRKGTCIKVNHKCIVVYCRVDASWVWETL